MAILNLSVCQGRPRAGNTHYRRLQEANSGWVLDSRWRRLVPQVVPTNMAFHERRNKKNRPGANASGLPNIKDKQRGLRPARWPELEIAYPCRHSRHK